MQLADQAHLLKQVVVVVDGGAVGAHCHVQAPGQHGVDRGNAVFQPQVGTGVMADCGPGPGQQVDVPLGKPNRVGAGQSGPQEFQVLQVFHGGLAPDAQAESLLVVAFHQVHVNGRLVAQGRLAGALQELVGVPLDVAGAEQHTEFASRVAVIAVVRLSEEGEVLVVGHVGGGQVPVDALGQVGGQAGQEVLVGGVDHPVLVAEVAGKGHPHAGVPEAPQHRVHVLAQGGGGGLGVVVHDGGGARLQHIQGSVEGHQVVVVGTATPAVENPQFQAVITGAHLQGGNAAAVVVGVDQARNYGVVGAAQFLVGLVAGAHFLPGADFSNYTVFLVHRHVGQGRSRPAGRRSEQVPASNQ